MFKQRLITGVVLAPIVLAAVFLLPSGIFNLFTGAITCLAAWEWARLSGIKLFEGQVAFAALISGALFAVYGFVPEVLWSNILIVLMLGWVPAFVLVATYPASVGLWRSPVVRLVMGVWALLAFWLALALVDHLSAQTLTSQTSTDGLSLRTAALLTILLLIWGADSGAYFAGKAFGKHKLAPKVSPGKTWEGVLGGVGAAVVVALVMHSVLEKALGVGSIALWSSILVAVGITALSIVGDLFESMLKRHVGLKDSSGLLPGHGGILDRIDSLIAAMPLFVLLLWVAQRNWS